MSSLTHVFVSVGLFALSFIMQLSGDQTWLISTLLMAAGLYCLLRASATNQD